MAPRLGPCASERVRSTELSIGEEDEQGGVPLPVEEGPGAEMVDVELFQPRSGAEDPRLFDPVHERHRFETTYSHAMASIASGPAMAYDYSSPSPWRFNNQNPYSVPTSPPRSSFRSHLYAGDSFLPVSAHQLRLDHAAPRVAFNDTLTGYAVRSANSNPVFTNTPSPSADRSNLDVGSLSVPYLAPPEPLGEQAVQQAFTTPQQQSHPTESERNAAPNFGEPTPDNPRSSRRPSNVGQAVFDTSVEDVLAVDDYQRNYDVREFTDRWRLQEPMPPAAGHLNWKPYGELPSESTRPPEIRAHDLRGEQLDMQGIDWASMGTTRRQARHARQLLHPPTRSHMLHMSRPNSASYLDEIESPLFRFNATLTTHRAQLTHFQLRNLLAATSRNDVFYASHSKIYHTSLACPSASDVFVDLAKPAFPAADFRITALAASSPSIFAGHRSDEVLLAGCFGGEYALVDVRAAGGATCTKGSVSQAWNGIVTHIHTVRQRGTGQLQAAFCANDNKIRILDVATNRFTQTFDFAAAPNCAATSPSGRLRAVVGDTCETAIVD
ncbi:hypothetical protein LTR66_014622, partial [Elasticomyces elasticus]